MTREQIAVFIQSILDREAREAKRLDNCGDDHTFVSQVRTIVEDLTLALDRFEQFLEIYYQEQQPERQEQDPISSLDFEEEIKPTNWSHIGIKLHTPTMEAGLLPPANNLILKRGNTFFGMKRDDTEALFHFLEREAQIAPQASEEPEWFKNFKPTPVEEDTHELP